MERLVVSQLIFTLTSLSSSSSEALPQRIPQSMLDAKHGVVMGVSNQACDDANTNLAVDWNGDRINYTCYHPTTFFWPDKTLEPALSCVNLPGDYYPIHRCMREPLSYSEPVPTYGDHRPLWPKFGEYKFVPPQRWLHNIEHGSVVMLYDPCALRSEVDKLKKLVKRCIRKHIITPYQRLTPARVSEVIKC